MNTGGRMARQTEKGYKPRPYFDELVVKREVNDSCKHGGKTVYGDAKKPCKPKIQIKLW